MYDLGCLENYQVIKKFKSKKNEVFLMRPAVGLSREIEQDLVVLKRFNTNYEKEAYWLSLLREHGIRVPEIIFHGENYLILNYLSGETLCAYLERQEKLGMEIQGLTPILKQFYQWLQSFYQVAQSLNNCILGDVNLKNFILHQNGQIYGIDFEECTPGEIEMDVGKICAFVLTYFPEYTTWKEALVKRLMTDLVGELSLDMIGVKHEFLQELQAIHRRRDLPVSLGKSCRNNFWD